MVLSEAALQGGGAMMASFVMYDVVADGLTYVMPPVVMREHTLLC